MEVRAKSEFLARTSHELRTPLNSIIGFSQVLQVEELEPRKREDIGYILRPGNHLLALVNEVLDLARIESGKTTISPEPVALADTIHDVLALVAATARERHLSLRGGARVETLLLEVCRSDQGSPNPNAGLIQPNDLYEVVAR